MAAGTNPFQVWNEYSPTVPVGKKYKLQYAGLLDMTISSETRRKWSPFWYEGVDN